MNKWNIKMIYPSGGHLVTLSNGQPMLFEDKQQATFECETLNSKRNSKEIMYIPVLAE